MHFTKSLLCLFSLAGSALTAATPVRSELETRVLPRATELIQSGLTFNIHNVKSGTVMDLSGVDNKSIIGYPLDSVGGENQKWTTLWTGEAWNFQNALTGAYLGIAGTAQDGQNLTVSTTPTGWDIWHDTVNETNYRVFIPNTSQNWDLYADGDATPGDPITLWGEW
ncbi:putative mannanase [Gymnopus androsaceus JB14]|uniref:Mannanase n=1 Tax=Gymnopus androsaceus JB14 TaxID=1447944 RepID=A0A6A4I617_9AGAR|nr:putative mannanase [Gymnopus androsaceus JB14]